MVKQASITETKVYFKSFPKAFFFISRIPVLKLAKSPLMLVKISHNCYIYMLYDLLN